MIFNLLYAYQLVLYHDSCHQYIHSNNIQYWRYNSTKTPRKINQNCFIDHIYPNQTRFKSPYPVDKPAKSFIHEHVIHNFVLNENGFSECIVDSSAFIPCQSFLYDSYHKQIQCFDDVKCGKMHFLIFEKFTFQLNTINHIRNVSNPSNRQYLGLPDRENFKNVKMNEMKLKISELLENVKLMDLSIVETDTSGIIICGYDGIMNELEILVKWILKHVDMEIQIFHANDLNVENVNKLSQLGVDVVNLVNSKYYKKREYQGFEDSRNYHLKPLAMLNTKFKHVIYLDSDAFPLFQDDYNPITTLLNALKSVDMVIFKDYWLSSPENPMMKILNINSRRQADSSVLAFNKHKVMKILAMSYLMCENPYFDQFMFGDKDSFWMAHGLLMKYNLMDEKDAKIIFNSDMVGYFGDAHCGFAMIHLIQNKVAFGHFNGIKLRIKSGTRIPQDGKVYLGVNLEGKLEDDYSQIYDIRWNGGNCLVNDKVAERNVDLHDLLKLFGKHESN
eukprot:NODE_562_length_5998_cov_1.109849.p1 type:complete len:503 gc:universal NODE_562_length_5998_cov_1.109849:4454-2946(-)